MELPRWVNFAAFLFCLGAAAIDFGLGMRGWGLANLAFSAFNFMIWHARVQADE